MRLNPRRHGRRGASMVEFALVAPMAFAVLFGIVVVGIVVMNQIQMTTAVRDSVRAAAVCGDASDPTTRLPNGNLCKDSGGNDTNNVQTYVAARLGQFIRNVQTPAIQVYDSTHTQPANYNPSDPMLSCATGNTVEISASFQQDLYLPLVGVFLGTGGTHFRTIGADAEAICQQ